MDRRNARATSSLRRPRRANINSASTIRWAPSVTRWLILRLLYVLFHDSSLRLLTVWNRLRTKPGLRYLRSRGPRRNRHLRWRNRSLSSPASSRRLPGTRSTSVPARTGILARLGARREESSISVLLRAWWWCVWLGCRCLLFGSSSRYVSLCLVAIGSCWLGISGREKGLRVKVYVWRVILGKGKGFEIRAS